MRARLVQRAQDWPWSSARAQLGLVEADGLTDVAPLHARVPDFAAHLTAPEEEATLLALRRAEAIGRPVGDAEFLAPSPSRAQRAN